MSRRIYFLIAVGLALVALAGLGIMYTNAVTAQGEGPAAYTLPERYEYSVKFVCGYSTQASQPPGEPAVKPGNYATTINIHNPHARKLTILKKVVVAYFERHPDSKPIPPSQRFKDVIPSDHAMAIDCTEIVSLLQLSGMPPSGTFIEGYVVIDTFFANQGVADADVDVVYTAAADPGGAVVDLEVDRVAGRKLPAGRWPY